MPDQDAQHAVFLGAAHRGQPIGDLALQHHHRVGQRKPFVDEVDQLEQDWRGDVIGQVARDSEPGPGHDASMA